MRRFLIMLIGLALLVAGGVLLWIAQGPQPSEARTTGGKLYSQQTLADQPESMQAMTAITDTQSGMMEVPVAPELSASAAQDLQSRDTSETSDAPQTVFEIEGDTATRATAGTALTTDIVLGTGTEVAVAPLSTGGGATISGTDGQGGAMSTTLGYEQRVVELEWPREFQVGRSGSVRVKLKMLENGALQPVAEIADNAVLATPILITDRYATHNAFVTATISAPDFGVDWVTPETQPLQKGGTAEWRWTLEGDSAETSVISLGLNISWEAQPGNPPGPQNVPIWGQAVQVEVNYVFGFITVPQASVLGSVLGVLGLVAQIPLLDWVLQFVLDILFGRNRRRRRQQRQNQRADSDRRNRRY